MNNKIKKYTSLFKHKSVRNLLNLTGSFEKLCGLLTENEVDQLYNLNVIFIRTTSPSSQIELEDLNINGGAIFINVDANLFTRLLPDELLAIILHEIGHAFNPGVTGMDGEYVADGFAQSKGYAKWIALSLQKGVNNKWIGFDKAECDLRIKKLQENINQ
jgi:hypothetical protein